jgi:hypothetical protein
VLVKPQVKECARCGYSLKGLPEEYQCPECGLKYDQFTTVWRARVRATTYLWALLMLWASGYAILSGLEEFSRGHPSIWWVILVVGVTGGLWKTLLQIIGRHGRRFFVAVTPVGLLSRTTAGEILLKWDDVADEPAGAHRQLPEVYRVQLSQWAAEVFQGDAQMRDFSEAVARAKARYGHAQPPAGNRGETKL